MGLTVCAFRLSMIGDAESMARIRALLTVSVTVAVILGGVQAADATGKPKRATVASTVGIDVVGPDGASGHVQSSRRDCTFQRRVSFYRVNSEQSVPSIEPVAFTWTGIDGSWIVPPPLYPSNFIAVAEAKKTKRTVCMSATSNSLGWG